MVTDLANTHPDDAYSVIPYEKGAVFLFYLENLLGGPGMRGGGGGGGGGGEGREGGGGGEGREGGRGRRREGKQGGREREALRQGEPSPCPQVQWMPSLSTTWPRTNSPSSTPALGNSISWTTSRKRYV